MGRRTTILLAVAFAACRGSTLPAPVLTLLPSSFDGGSLREGERCLAPGEAAVAAVYVHESSVTFTVRGRDTGDGGLEVMLGAEHLESSALEPSAPLELTYRAHSARGNQALRLARPPAASGVICLTQVAVTQP